MTGGGRLPQRKDDPLRNTLQIIGIIALALSGLAAVVILVYGIREAPSLMRYLRMRRM